MASWTRSSPADGRAYQTMMTGRWTSVHECLHATGLSRHGHGPRSFVSGLPPAVSGGCMLFCELCVRHFSSLPIFRILDSFEMAASCYYRLTYTLMPCSLDPSHHFLLHRDSGFLLCARTSPERPSLGLEYDSVNVV